MLPVNIDEYASLLPLDDDQLLERHVNPLMLERLHRIRGLYAFWLQYPNKSIQEMVCQDTDMFKVSQSKAYEDIKLVQTLLGNIQAMTKDFARWRFNMMNERHIRAAERDHKHRAIAAMEKNYIIANQLDKEDTPDMAFDKIVPLQIEPTDDPTVLGIKRIPDLRGLIKKMIAKYSKSDIEDAQYIEIEEDGQSE